MRVGIYHHALPEELQLSGSQLRKMQRTAAANGWQIFRVYQDSTENNRQPAFQTMLEDARERRFDILLFWSLQQLRPGVRSIIRLLNNLSTWQISFCSCTEPHLDTYHKDKDILISTFASMARHDSNFISQRTHLGLERQRKDGNPGPHGYLKPGRPPVPFNQKQALALRARHLPYTQIAVACKVSQSTVQRFFKCRE